MKKTYETPKLVVHGTVENLTNVLGASSATDTLFIAGQPFGGGFTDGSSDLRLP